MRPDTGPGSTNDTPTDRLQRSPWLGRLACVAGAFAGFGILLSLDLHLERWRTGWMPVTPSGFFEQLLIGFRDFGQILTVITAIILVAAYDPTRRKRVIICLLLAQLFAGIGYHSIKGTVMRARPNSELVEIDDPDSRVADTWLGLKAGNFEKPTRAFPSGHSASAFAIATVLALFYPRIRWWLWLLAVGCACSRYLEGFHWVSDCWAGSILGYLSGRLALWTNGITRQG
jgi:undecaprenyl-diphosphatase